MKLVFKKKGRWPVRTWRPTDNDRRLMNALTAKLHLSESNVLRLGLVRLEEFEGIEDAGDPSIKKGNGSIPGRVAQTDRASDF
jgi:hypothetical protein